MKKILFILLLYIPITGYAQTDCTNLPKTFTSYEQALYEVKNSKFKLVDNVNTSRSSIVTGVSYYSCDGQTGFLIVGLNNRQYIHRDIPVKIWLSFKQASSFGSFYNQNIRNNYRLTIKP